MPSQTSKELPGRERSNRGKASRSDAIASTGEVKYQSQWEPLPRNAGTGHTTPPRIPQITRHRLSGATLPSLTPLMQKTNMENPAWPRLPKVTTLERPDREAK